MRRGRVVTGTGGLVPLGVRKGMNDPLGLIEASQSGLRGIGGGAAGGGRVAGGPNATPERAAKFRAALQQEVAAADRLQQDAAASAERVRSSDDQLASLNAATRQADDALETLMKLSTRMQAMRGINADKGLGLDSTG